MKIVVYWRRSWYRGHPIPSGALQVQALAQHLGMDEREIKIAVSENGKPFLEKPGQPRIHFSVSHSGERWAMAIAGEQPVGLDIERIKARRHLGKLARRVFGREALVGWSELETSEQLDSFYQAWTLKEACIKAVGGRLFSSLSSVELIGPKQAKFVCRGDKITARSNSIWMGYATAIASPSRDFDVEWRELVERPLSPVGQAAR